MKLIKASYIEVRPCKGYVNVFMNIIKTSCFCLVVVRGLVVLVLRKLVPLHVEPSRETY